MATLCFWMFLQFKLKRALHIEAKKKTQAKKKNFLGMSRRQTTDSMAKYDA